MSDEPKRLYRSTENRWLAGICGGLGAYFGLDPTLIRVLFVLFALAVGGGVLLYFLLWIIIPLKPAVTGESLPVPGEEVEAADES